jgi:hypothetical protein
MNLGPVAMGARDADALSFAAAQLMRKAVRVAAGKADLLEDGTARERRLTREPGEVDERAVDRRTHRLARIERGDRSKTICACPRNDRSACVPHGRCRAR